MSALLDAMMDSPSAVLEHDMYEAYHFTADQVRRFQDRWVAKRFADLRPRVPMLDKLAKEQGIDSVTCVDDAAPLLFSHTVYKSYPMSYLENYRFDKLTKWLSGLTTTDLGRVDAKDIDSINAWFDELDAKTDLLVAHTSGTTGKLSFLPRTKQQSLQLNTLYSNIWRDFNGPNTGPDMIEHHRPLIFAGYRYGASMGQRQLNLQVQQWAGGEHNALFLYPEGRLSADVMSLSGRIRAAEAKGELGSLKIPASLLKRREEYIAREKDRPQAMTKFLEVARERFGKQDVFFGAMYGPMFDCAVEGLKRGQSRLFGRGSFVGTGGGRKGRVFPPNWRETIEEFFGFPLSHELYAMSECMVPASLCQAGKYHFPPMAVPYVLDPKTGKVLPRKDGTTGRMALLDLMPETFWAGFISGDEVTAGGWEQPCNCGRTSFYIDSNIRRYSEQEGGDDKILCGGAPEAHDSAIAFLAEYAQ